MRRALLGLACWQPNVVYFMVGAGFDELFTRWMSACDWVQLAPYLTLVLGLSAFLKAEWPAWR